MNTSQTTKLFSFVALGLFVLTGTYNSVVINSESQINGTESKFVKRLDEIYGVTVSGREVAASVNWQKLSPTKTIAARPQKILDSVKTIASAASEVTPDAPATNAAVQEELSLSLVEVINPKKWQQALASSQFSGALTTNNGVIEDLSVSLPNSEGISVSFSEMSGNVFEYDMNGELYSGMMYQVDQNSYMVTLTNGPLEGTRLRFAGEAPAQPEQPQSDQAQVADASSEQSTEQPYQQAQEAPVIETAQLEQPQQPLETPEQMNQNDLMIQQQAMEGGFATPEQQTM